ncbi:MAG: DUF3828 domain-containing protein [Bacteroidetes bacterium]|nr:DUF3828 domain-containing protein [Bacteroidota bacterium]
MAFLLAALNTARAQGKDPVATELRAFYDYYIVENAGPIKRFSQDTLERYCCKAFLHKMNTDKELDADPLLWVQDYDSSWVKTLQIIRLPDRATKKYKLCFFDNYERKNICMTVFLKKEEGKWKIYKTCSGGYCYQG